MNEGISLNLCDLLPRLFGQTEQGIDVNREEFTELLLSIFFGKDKIDYSVDYCNQSCVVDQTCLLKFANNNNNLAKVLYEISFFNAKIHLFCIVKE